MSVGQTSRRDDGADDFATPGVRRNRLKAKLAAGCACLGVTMRFPSETAVEIAARAGCDFVIFDIEHEGFGVAALQSMIRVAALAGTTPIARVGRGYEHLVDPLLAAGAQGFSLARVRSPDDVTALTDMLYYHPQGKRTSYQLSRAAGFGVGVDSEAWWAATNREILVHAIIEERAAIDNLDAILAHPLLDVIEVGPSDLRLSMGVPPAAEIAAIERDVFARAVAAGKWILDVENGHALSPRVWREVRDGHGAMIVASASGILMSALSGMVAETRARSKPASA